MTIYEEIAFAEEKLEYKVTYDGSFWCNEGRRAKEIFVGKSFTWGENQWYVPAIYTCGKGLIIDFCMEVEVECLKQFMEKWDLFHEDLYTYPKEQREQIQREHPLNIEFTPKVKLNGKELQEDYGCAISWIPVECLEEDICNEAEAKIVLEHYGLDASKAWSIHRYTFLWNTKRIPKMKSLYITMERRPVDIPAICFASPKVGDVFTFTHPVTLTEYTLTIHEYKQQKLEQRNFWNKEEMEYPTHYTAMTYTISPDISGMDFMLRDLADGDSPRAKNPKPNEFGPIAVCSVGIIGSADGPTILILSNGEQKVRVACSSLYFEEKQEMEWCLTFAVKQVEDIRVKLME